MKLEEAAKEVYELVSQDTSNWVDVESKNSIGLDGHFDVAELKKIVSIMESIDGSVIDERRVLMNVKTQTMTVNRLQKILSDLISKGNGRLPICVNKDTFRDNREGDGCVILPVEGVNVESVLQSDDDGGTKINKDGSESYRRTVVLFGSGKSND